MLRLWFSGSRVRQAEADAACSYTKDNCLAPAWQLLNCGARHGLFIEQYGYIQP